MWEEGPGVLGEMRRRGELATFALSSSSEREEEEDEDDEEEKRRQRQHQFLYEEEEEVVVVEEEEVKLRDETNADYGLVQAKGKLFTYEEEQEGTNELAPLSDFEELEYDDSEFDEDGSDDGGRGSDDDDIDDVERAFNRNALVWLRSDVIDDSNRRSTKANNISAEENELLAWDEVRGHENRFSLLASLSTTPSLDFDVLYERAFNINRRGVKDLDYNYANGNNNCICADESNLVTMCLNAVMGDSSSRKLLRALSSSRGLDDDGVLSVRFRGASIGATRNTMSQFYETARERNRLRAFATKHITHETRDSTAKAFQKCVLKIIQAMDASLSTFADACIQRRVDEEEGEDEPGNERKTNRKDETTLLEFAFHTRDIRKQIASLADLVNKVQKRWRAMMRKSPTLLSSSLSPQRCRRSRKTAFLGSVALDVLSREIQDLHYNDYLDIELEQRSVLKLFEILFVSMVKPALVEGIVNACFSSNDSSSSCSARIDDEYLTSACNVLLQNKTDAIRKLRSVKNSMRDIHREEKFSQFCTSMRACKSLLFSPNTPCSSEHDDDADTDLNTTSIVRFFTKEFDSREIFREASRALDEAINFTDALRAEEKEAVEFELRKRARIQREKFEARVRKHEIEQEKIRQNANAKKKELGDARRLEMFERAERKKEAKVNELTEDLERLGTFSGSAVKKRVRLMESQMNRSDREGVNSSLPQGEADEGFDNAVIADEQNHAAAEAEAEESKEVEKLVEQTAPTVDSTMETYLPRPLRISSSFLSSNFVMCKRSIVDVTASNLWAFLDFLHEKVSRVHVSYLLKDHEVVSHANYIAEIIFGLSGDVIETLCEKKDDASDDYGDFASSQITYFTDDQMREALERANISSNVVQDRFIIIYSKDNNIRNDNKKSIKCLSYVLPEQLQHSNLFGTDFEEKIEAVSAFVLRLKSVLATLQNLRKISNDLDRATYINDGDWKLDHASKETTVSRRRLRSFQEQLFELERFAKQLERSCGENIRHATDVLNASMNASAEIDATDAKSMISKWLNACVAASFASKDLVRTRKVVEEGFRNILLFAQQTFNAYNDADPSAILDNAVFISTSKGLRGEFIGSVVRVFQSFSSRF